MKLLDYSEKPKPKFAGRDAYYLGIELEVEAPDPERRQQGLELNKQPKHFYAKRDSSLNNNGWELITHPVARNEWVANQQPGTTITREYKGVTYNVEMTVGGVQVSHNNMAGCKRTFKSLTAAAKAITGYASISGPAFFGQHDSPIGRIMQMVGGLRALGYTSHEGGRCGLHVHVCRKAFDDSDHLYRFCRLVNNPLFAKLSQRTDFHYCEQTMPTSVRQPDGTLRIETNYLRARAVNLQPAKTVEVRIFRGNMREDRIRKAVESVIAAIEFTRTNTNCFGLFSPDQDFVKYVRDNSATYPNLNRYLTEIRADDNNETVSNQEEL